MVETNPELMHLTNIVFDSTKNCYTIGGIKVVDEAEYQELREKYPEGIEKCGVTFDDNTQEYSIMYNRVFVAEFLLGGDKTALFKLPSMKEKKQFTHFSIKTFAKKHIWYTKS